MQVCQFSASSSLQFLRRRILNMFFEYLPFKSPRQPIKLSDLDKSHMQHGGLLNIHICEKRNSNISSETAETINFHFSRYKSMGTICCHSNQSSYLTGIKNTAFVQANVLSMYASFSFIPLMDSEKMNLNIFTKIDPFCCPDNQSNSPIWIKVV